MKHALCPAVAIVLTVLASEPAIAATSAVPSLEDRVAARRAVEDVLWRHRLWPADNPQAKPPLSAVLPDAEIRSRVVDDLRKSRALATLWGRPVTDAMLQAELDRMRTGSRAPEVLQELLAAVGNDPVLAREAIARPALVDRLIRSWYAHDDRFHGDLRGRADAMAADGAAVVETAWVKRGSPADRPGAGSALDAQEWGELTASLQHRFGSQDLLAGMSSPASDDDDAFRSYTVLERADGRLRLRVTSWPKRTFESWWSQASPSIEPELAIVKGEVPATPLSNTPGSCSNDTWHPLGGLTPLQRYSHSAVWTGSEMIVWGGWTPVGPFGTATGGRYAPATDSWYATSTAGAPSARVGHRAVWTGTEMIVWGGQQDLAGPYGPLGDGARYAPQSDSWIPMSSTGAPSARRDFTMVWTGNRAIVFGGQDETVFTSTGGRYDPSTDSWTPTSATGAPVARGKHTAVWTGSVMVVWGGSGASFTNTGGRYDPGSDSWQPTSTSGAPSARSEHTAVWTGSKMIVWGGHFISSYYDDGGLYDPGADSWVPLSTVDAPPGRSNHTAVWAGTRMIVWGGWVGTAGTEYATGGRYDPVANSWTVVATAGAPERRELHTAVWTGTEMIVWGGVWALPHPGNFIAYLYTGGRYDPATDSWVPTSIRDTGPPEGRQKHSAVWTGTETIFWGGQGFSGSFLGDGVRYVAATDSWWPTIAAGAPSPRLGHAAVWTGTEMILWGGNAGTTYFDTGARYQPASDTWSAMSAAGAPSARTNHTAVWTGSRVVVWGGSSPSFATTGGRYDPASDSWSATSLTGAPQARIGHAAFWTGSRMIVWGGDGGAALGTGGLYDPVGDTWSVTSMTGAPSARVDFASVWTGTRLLVWGGNSAGLLGDGARYDPVGNAWAAMSAVNAPAARRWHSAVWTGSEMVVWGGIKSDGATTTGGRYLASGDSWSSTVTAGAPAARTAHSAVWAGDKMLIWGGLASGDLTNTGASYCACRTFWRDDDGDGYGNGDGGAPTMETCNGTTPAGWVDNGLDCWDANPLVHPGVTDNTCNGVDDDCNGAIDDLWLGGLSHCGLGVCQSTGFFECNNGQIVNNCTPGAPTAPIDDVCNALDDDCDGAVDDDFVHYQDSWSAIAAAPNTRTNQTAVWSGSEMIVFGGDNGSGSVKAGGEAYAPATNTWRTLAVGPLKRWHHTAVWTGSRMVVWGGDDNAATVYNTGSRYDPATDTWAATTTTGAPTPRGGHTAVWTGARMVVWGGSDSVNTYNTGSRYDPTGNTWSATATSGAPAVRLFHTAVWTSTDMIVWGGQSAPGTGGALATGGRYNPTTNAWVATATSGAPSARYGHVAVWTGTEMLIWGGTNGTTYLSGGARYNPATNSWNPMSPVGAPSQRAWASAVWTGSELIVWGGMYKTNEVPDTPLSDGARYNPATDTWTAMSPYSAPGARARASAVWSGTELIVWGGDPVGAARSDGGRYSLQTVCGTGGCQRTGAEVCIAGVISFQCVPAPSTPEVCDGIDNNCNVTVDEGIPVPSGHPAVFTAKLDPAGLTQFTWSVTADTTGYDVMKGALGTLRATSGDYAAASSACLANGVASPSLQDPGGPPIGDGFWYLVRPDNACSSHGTYDDSLPPQQGSRDGEIAASGVGCP